MAEIPKPRKPGQTGGSRNQRVNRSTHAAARVNQKGQAKFTKRGCVPIMVVTIGAIVTVVTGAGYGVAALLS